MDGGRARVQGLRQRRIAPAAPVFTDVGFEHDPRLEPLRCRGPPGVHQGSQRFAFLGVESDHRLEHQRSPLRDHHAEENQESRTAYLSS
jgi:hypothetical protein